MRVITGTARGRRLAELPGLDTRPTTDRVKEGLFSAIQFDIEGRRVLDLFAGSGALSLEAVSRGAALAVMADRDQAAIAAEKQNVRALGFGAGMGLPNMKKYTDEMTIDSTVGVGTTVRMAVVPGRKG